MSNKQENLFRNLKHILDNTDAYFDEGLVQYIFDNLSPEMLKDEKMTSNILKGYHLETNIWGKISILKYIHEYEEEYLKWVSAISKTKNSSEIMVDPVFNIEQNKKNYNIDLNTLLVLKEIKNWQKLESKNVFLTKKQELLVIQDLLKDEQSYYIYSDEIQNNFLLEKLKKYLPELKAKGSFVNILITSEPICRILSSSKSNDLVGFLDSLENNELLSLYKKSHNKEVFKQIPNLVSNLIPLYENKVWIDVFNKDKLNIFEVFALIIKKASGNTFDKNLSVLKHKMTYPYSADEKLSKSSSASKEMAKRFIAWGDMFKNVELTEEEKIKWYTSLLNCPNNKDIYLASRKFIELPKNETKIGEYFHTKYANIYKELEVEVLYTDLNEKVSASNTVKRKSKI